MVYLDPPQVTLFTLFSTYAESVRHLQFFEKAPVLINVLAIMTNLHDSIGLNLKEG